MGGRGSRRAKNDSEWQLANSEWFFWRAVLLHCRKILLLWRAALLRCRLIFGRAEARPSSQNFQTPNKFGAQEFRRQLLAEGSGMVGIRTLSILAAR